MMKKLLPILAIIAIVFFVNSCEPREEAKTPTADFSYSPATEIKVGEVVTFTNTSLDYTDVLWDFGDGSNTSEVPNPTHIYDEARTFNVTLIAENKGKKDQITKPITIIPAVEACFSMSPNPADTYEAVYFTNCSEGADSYEWDMNSDGEIESYDEEPVFEFYEAGTYNVTLKAYAGDSYDEITHSLTINENQDPAKDYGNYEWGTVDYLETFDSSHDWFEGSGDDFELYTADGFYTMIDKGSDYGYFVTNDYYTLPTGNYDVEVLMRNTTDPNDLGSGIISEANDNAEYNYLRFRYGEFKVGDTDGAWQDWTSTTAGDIEDWNYLTMRKIGNKIYFFMNTEFLYVDDYSSFGDLIGFIFDRNSKIEIDAIGVGLTVEATDKKSAKTQNLSLYSKSVKNYNSNGEKSTIHKLSK